MSTAHALSRISVPSFSPDKESGLMDRLGVRRWLPYVVGLALLASLSAVSPSAQADSPVVTHLTYDAGDNVATVTDPRGLVTTYTHDGLGQLWQQVSPDTGTTSVAYDAYGRTSSTTRANGVQTTYGYDGIGRHTTISAGGQTQTLAYDSCTNGIGRLCSDSDASGSTSYSYTPEGWVAGRGFSMGSTTYAIGYSHDAMGHVSVVNYPDGNKANYTYTDGDVSAVTLTIGSATVNGATAITYRPMDMAMATWTSSNGLVNTASYDTDGRLTGISVPGKQSLGFSYDTADRITQIANGIDPSVSQTFRYDAMSRLNFVSSTADNESYQYDANGNRLTATVNGAAQTYGISATSNQMTSFSSTLSATYGYDTMGNTTVVNGGTVYQYNPFNRLTSAGGATNYINPEGQRLRKAGGSTGTTYFAPDQGGALLAESDNGTWVDYLWLNGRIIGRISSGQVYAIHDDQVGRPEAVTDSGQNVVWRAQNLPFTQNITVASVTFNLGFPGQYYDAETQTWNNGYRDYHGGFGRYLESDPMGLGGGINSYIYAGNSPISSTDASGLCSSKKCEDALTAAGQTMSAVQNAEANWVSIQNAVADSSIDPALVAAIGIRETGFTNIAQIGGGQGAGVFQIDLGANPSISTTQAYNVPFAANIAAAMLNRNMSILASSHPNFTKNQLLQATAASYNFGTGNITGNPSTIDTGTTGNNYGSNVVNLMSCFLY